MAHVLAGRTRVGERDPLVGQQFGLERVLAALRSFRARDHRPTSQEVAAETGLSYPTVRRYLEFLSSRKQVEQAVVYQDGRPGRPLYTYRLLDEG